MPHEGEHELSVTVPSAPQREPAPANLEPDDAAAKAVLAAIAEGLRRLRFHEPAASQGQIEGVHGMRTATRRLRSALRTFRDLVEDDWARPLEEELKWLGEVLGAVRDLDVLVARLNEAAADSTEMLGPLFRSLETRHETASAALRAVLAGERYRALLARMQGALAAPKLDDSAREPCGVVLPPLVARAWRSLKKRARALGPHDADEDFHDVRKRAKRVRYAAELVADALDSHRARSARRFGKRTTKVQDVLGEFQDAIVAGQEVARVVAEHPDDGPFNLAAGRLLERQACAANQARARFFKVWDKYDRRSDRRWFKS